MSQLKSCVLTKVCRVRWNKRMNSCELLDVFYLVFVTYCDPASVWVAHGETRCYMSTF